MANSVQKKIKFSKGQISPNLIERTDLDLYNSSAQKIQNFESTFYGGLRTRRGTMYRSRVYGSTATGTATSNIGGTTSNIQSLDTVYTSGTIGTQRNLISIDYGSVLDSANIILKGVKINSDLVLKNGSGNFIVQESGYFTLKLVGGGGGASGGTYGSGHKTTGGNGGSGAVFYGTVYLDAGTYTLTQGVGGTGGTANNSYGNKGTGGTASTLSKDGKVLISAGGGAGGLGRGTGGVAGGTGGVVSYSLIVSNKINIQNGAVGSTTGFYGYGAGGKGNYKVAGSNGSNGYIEIARANLGIKIEKSADNSEWEEVASSVIGKTASDLSVGVLNFKYIRITSTENSDYNLGGAISFNYIRNVVSSGKCRMIKFEYNNTQEYIIVLSDKRIAIYQEGVLIQEITYTKLLEKHIDGIRYTYKDDTVVLTHPDINPIELKRTGTEFTCKDFELKNIPYYAFGGEKSEKKTIIVTPSGVEGAIKITAKESVFNANYVGQFIDGNGGRLKVTEYIDDKTVNGYTVIPFYTDDEIKEWQYVSGYDKVWSSTRGYPRTCLFAQQRLWFGGSRDLPTHVWASRLGDYNNFKNAGNYANDAIDIEMLTNNPILNLVEQRGIHIFTAGEEWTAGENSLTPDSISLACNTRNGSLGLSPIIMNGVVFFVEKNGESLLGYVYNYEQASFVTDDYSIYGNLIKRPVAIDAEINSNRDKGNFLYIVLEDGVMLTGCVMLSQNIFSISQFVTDGKVRDVCCLKNSTYLLIEREGELYLEELKEVKTDLTQVGYVDGNVIPNMEMYQGKNVYVYDDNNVEIHYCDGGEIYLDNEYHKDMYVGLPFQMEIESNPIAIDNTTFTRKKRIAKATVATTDTVTLEFNDQKKSNCKNYDFYACTSYGDDVRFNIKGEFYPINILSITLNLNFEG